MSGTKFNGNDFRTSSQAYRIEYINDLGVRAVNALESILQRLEAIDAPTTKNKGTEVSTVQQRVQKPTTMAPKHQRASKTVIGKK